MRINYRKIYTDYYKIKILKDSEGRSYEIHHIDGNHSNNDPLNLKSVSLQEHYDIHYSQGNYGACYLIARKMNLSPEILSEIASKSATKSNLERVAKGIHPFSGGKIQKDKVANGTHHLLGGVIGGNNSRERVVNKTHNFLGSNVQKKFLEEGKHHSQQYHICPNCGKEGYGNAMKQWHFDNCKSH